MSMLYYCLYPLKKVQSKVFNCGSKILLKNNTRNFVHFTSKGFKSQNILNNEQNLLEHCIDRISFINRRKIHLTK